MSMDLAGITNKNEYYSSHYFATVFEENAKETITAWTAAAKETEEGRTPWSLLRQGARQYYAIHDRYMRSGKYPQLLARIMQLADGYLKSLGYPAAKPETVGIDDELSVPVYLEMKKPNGSPLLWVLLSASQDMDDGILESHVFDGKCIDEDGEADGEKAAACEMTNEELVTKILFGQPEPPRFVLLIGMNQIALIDRNKWNEKRYLQFELEEIFARLEDSTLKAMAVLLHKDSLCPDDGRVLLDELDEESHRHASGVSQDLKYALRESIELLGNEVLYDMTHRLGRNLTKDPVDAGQLTLECLRYMYRMLFVLFMEARPELGYAPMKAQPYLSGYSLESLRDIAESVREDVDQVGDGYYLHETLSKLYDLIYDGYPKTEEELKKASASGSLHDMFLIAPLKAHIFDPEYTKMITAAKLRNSCMLRIIDLMSLSRESTKKGSRRGRISYANLGINQMGAVYEALLSYRGFIAHHDLYEVKKKGDRFNELDVGYFVSEEELPQYDEDERVRYEEGEKKGQLRVYRKGTFIYRLAGREREKSASYYTPEVLTKCLVKYALKELLKDKTADEILRLTVCEPAMGSAAFLNEAITQLAEAYISKKEEETGTVIGYENRFNELQKVKMYIADRNVYGVDLNPVAVELAEVSLWLNTIYEGGFVPWFGTQLMNGNSLIGARREVYSEALLTTKSKGLHWYEKAPERLSLGTERKKKTGYSQIYHFLLGDPGMACYADKVIKSLEPEHIKKMKEWNKKFIAPYTADDLATLRRLSAVIDDLWKQQIALRKKVEAKTRDSLSVFGHQEEGTASHTTIREKDRIYAELYKSEHMRNAGPYARLKFAMDYWCALWFWPIEKAELLPSRSEFLFDMSLILEGTMDSFQAVDADKREQMSLFPELVSEEEQLVLDFNKTYGVGSVVDIPKLRRDNPRLDLAARIAEANHFMHWELEFADLFADRGGFDLIIGNPPWIKLKWNEQGILSDANPMFAVKKLTATQTTHERAQALEIAETRKMYFSEYESISGEQNFLNATQNYPDLKGQQTNLFKCFLPLAWERNNAKGCAAFVHPEGVYDEPNGGALRGKVYSRLRYHFQFANERKLFHEVHHHTTFSLNVYGGPLPVSFDTISNLYDVKTIAACYEGDPLAPVPGIKDEKGEWNIQGHPDRIIHVTKKELMLFAKLFDGNEEWKSAKLPVISASQIIGGLECFLNVSETVDSLGQEVTTSLMWDETNAQKDGTITRDIHFPDRLSEVIYSGPHTGVCNPLFKCSRAICNLNSDYDNIDLLAIPKNYVQRINYFPNFKTGKYWSRVSITAKGGKITDDYRLMLRKMLNISGERTLIGGIIPPCVAHTNGLIGIDFSDTNDLLLLAGSFASLPFDFLVKTTGKSNFTDETVRMMPIASSCFDNEIKLRALLLNCLTCHYADLWSQCFDESFMADGWAKAAPRLLGSRFSALTAKWTWDTPLRTDYERRQALVELDVITAMALGMTLPQLKTIYRIQFPVLQSYEADTWYDRRGRIVFTNNRSLTGVGYSRPEFEKPGAVTPTTRSSAPWDGVMKNAPAGYVFSRTITDDTQPGGPVERTIEYEAPFDRCDREADYETVWHFFEEKYGKPTEE